MRRVYAYTVMLVLTVVLCTPHNAHAVLTNGANAVDLLGQFASTSSDATPVYTTNGINNNNGATVTALGFYHAVGVALDAVNHRLFVADQDNDRVVVYNLNTDNSFPDHTADNVLGAVNLTTIGTGGATQSTFRPSGLAFDAVNNRLFVADYDNNRVLVFNTSSISNGMNAANVLGQANFTSGGSSATQSTMQNPDGVCYDSVNSRLFVGDAHNNRVMVFDVAAISDGENAVNVLGQANFTDAGGAASQSRLYSPVGCAYDAVRNYLFVTDHVNSRVMVFNVASISDGQNAIKVLGQTNFTNNGAATSQSRMNEPNDVGFDATNNRLFVLDQGNHRVLVYRTDTITDGMNASNVLGQANFTSGSNGVTQSTFSWAGFLAYDPGSGRLFVGEYGNNRVIIFAADHLSSNFHAFGPW